MPVIADIHADLAKPRVENRVAAIARREIKLFPMTRMAVRDVVLAILPKVSALVIDHRRRVVVKAGHVLLRKRNNQHHAVLPGLLLHELDRGAVRNRLSHLIPAGVLLGWEIRAVEKLL